MTFYKAQQSNPGFELSSQLIITFLLSKVFNSQFLTQTDISFSRFSNFKVQNGHSRFTLKCPLTKIGDLKNKCAINSNIDYVSFKLSTIEYALNRKIIVAGSVSGPIKVDQK